MNAERKGRRYKKRGGAYHQIKDEGLFGGLQRSINYVAASVVKSGKAQDFVLEREQC